MEKFPIYTPIRFDPSFILMNPYSIKEKQFKIKLNQFKLL